MYRNTLKLKVQILISAFIKKKVCVHMYVKKHHGIKKTRDALVIINKDSLLYEKKVKWGNRADFNTFAFHRYMIRTFWNPQLNKYSLKIYG